MTAGIDDISIYIPRLYLDAGDFAKARGLDPEKLERGLGIGQMAIVDTNQDPACLASNACLRVMQKNKLTPDKIGRLYVATESSFDESKAMNSYVIGMLEQVTVMVLLDTVVELNVNLLALVVHMRYMIILIGLELVNPMINMH